MKNLIPIAELAGVSITSIVIIVILQLAPAVRVAYEEYLDTQHFIRMRFVPANTIQQPVSVAAVNE